MSHYIFFYASVSHLVIKLVEKLLNLGKIRPKKKLLYWSNRPTLILPPTLDIFIYLFFFEEKK